MNQTSETHLRQTIVEIGQRMYQRGYVAANDGNISVRLDAERILTTPTGVSKGHMHAAELVVVDLGGKPLSEGKPSTELPLHLYLYKERTDIQAVVHAHPPYATGFATAGIPLDKCVLAEIIVTIGTIPLAKYGTPSTQELPETLQPYVHSCDAFLMANHGIVTVGLDLMDAYFKLE
ncbi:MAG: class II aldolase/adducin family protein, partial [bacterium]